MNPEPPRPKYPKTYGEALAIIVLMLVFIALNHYVRSF